MLYIDCSSGLNFEVLKKLFANKKTPENVNLKKLDYVKMNDSFQFIPLINKIFKEDSLSYEFIYVDSYIELFMVFSEKIKIKSLVNKQIKKLSKFAFRFNIFVICKIISELL